MTFSGYAWGLFPYLSNGIGEADYFVEMIGSFVKDAALDACKPLRVKPDTQYRYVKGYRHITPQYAKYIYDNRDTLKFEEWVERKMDENDSYDAVCDWLKAHGLPYDDPIRECTYLLEQIILDIVNKESLPDNTAGVSEIDLDLIAEIEKKIKRLPKPKEVAVPPKFAKEEDGYIKELYKAYGDAENISSFSQRDLENYPDYAEDLDERRIDYYAAESIRRGVQELKTPSLTNQFDVLKESTYKGVKDTERKKYPDGYERMLSVMEQSVKVPAKNYLLSSSPYWISEKIQKGVCHHLVNDGRLHWVKTSNKEDKK
jgi:hypothetical protein